jgi:DNA-binding MarR family transcriptional regulator
MDSDYLVALESNISAYLKHNKITIHHWLNPRLIILLKLYKAYPEPLPQASFIDDLHDRQTISRAVNHLKDTGFVLVERYAGQIGRPKFLHLSDKGVEFINHIDPEGKQ